MGSESASRSETVTQVLSPRRKKERKKSEIGMEKRNKKKET